MNLSKRQGFTLIELMIVVLILGIIVAIAFPAYTNQVQKTRRADATTALLGAAQQLERCFTRTNSYSQQCVGDFTSENGHYDIVFIPDDPPVGYKLRATPKGPQAGDKCKEFTFFHTGERKAAFKLGEPSDSAKQECWRQ